MPEQVPTWIRPVLPLVVLAMACAPPHPAGVTPPGRGPDIHGTDEEVRAAPVVPTEKDTAVAAMPAPPAAMRAQEVEAVWRDHAPLPESRTEVSATTDGRYIYLAGGLGPPEAGARASAPRTLWRYDARTDEWLALTELPAGVHHAPFQYHDGRLFILGGFAETSFEPVANVRIYDLASNQWQRLTPVPTARHGLGAAAVADAIHVLSGGPEPAFSFGSANERVAVPR